MTNPKIAHHHHPIRPSRSSAQAWFNHFMALPVLVAGSMWCPIGMSSRVLAETGNLPSSQPAVCSINLNLLKSNIKQDHIVTADTVSAQAVTLPSLWWTSEQFPAKLVTNWIANATEKEVYLLVNPQYWNILDYVDRYRLINQFGQVARGYGYNLQLCTPQKVALANYTCDLDHPQSSCQIWLNAIERDGLGVRVQEEGKSNSSVRE